jgi:hypothetical protein
MTLNSNLIVQKFADLWEKEVQASQARRDADERETAAEGTDLQPAAPLRPPSESAPQVVTRARRPTRPAGSPDSSEASNESGSAHVVETQTTPQPSTKTPRVFRLPSAASTPAIEDDQLADSQHAAPSLKKSTRARRSSGPGSSIRAPSPPRIIVAPPHRPIENSADPRESQQQADLRARRGHAVLERLATLAAVQRLAVLLTADGEALACLSEQQVADLIESAWQQCDKAQIHQLHPRDYWKAADVEFSLAATSRANSVIGPMAAGTQTLSLLGLLVRADRFEILECIDPARINPHLVAAELDQGGSIEPLSALGLALNWAHEAFIDWSARHWDQLDRPAHPPERKLTQLLARAIESWSANGRPPPSTRLHMTMTLLKLGALIDREHLLLLAPGRTSAGASQAATAMNALEVWNELARQAHASDPHGLAALQLMISAATFRYDLMPRPGSVNPMTHYVAGDHPRAVEMFLQSGFDPLLPDAQGQSPRGHGAKASEALAVIDLHLAHRRLEELQHGADRLREIDDLLGLASR